MPFSAPQLQRRWKALPGESVGDAGDAYTGYDRFGRVERMRWGKLGDGGSFSPLVDVSWGHSPSSQKTWRKDLLAPAGTAQDQKFDYDALYQLTQRQRGVLNVNLTSAGGVPAQQEDFDYDETGNWKGYRQQNAGAPSIDQTRVNNRSNQITQVDGSSAGISYDKNGNMLTVPTGEALTDPSNRIVWDGWNRPAKVYDAADNLLAEYRYDGLGRRVTVTSGGITRHTYYDDQWRSIEERLDGSTGAERQHVWHPADRWEMILRDRSTANNGVMDERLFPLKDQLDPVAIADDTGNVVERFSYTAFGIPTFLDSSFNPQPPAHAWDFLFHAEFQDAETGWFNYGYRYYESVMGRWLSRDPIDEEGGVNLCAVEDNNPTNLNDSYGLLVWNTNGAQWDTNLADGQKIPLVPGGPQDKIGVGTFAVTTIRWKIEVYCGCKPNPARVFLGEITINYHASVSMRKNNFYRGTTNQRKIKNQSKRDWTIVGEQEHVKDFDDWANGDGKRLATEFERLAKIGFAPQSIEKCEEKFEKDLEEKLRPSALSAINKSIARWDGIKPQDKPSKPHFWKGTDK